MVQPRFTEKEKDKQNLKLLTNVLNDWEKQSQQQKVAIAQTYSPKFKGSSFETVKGFISNLNNVVREMNRPQMVKAKGGRLLPKWVVDELSKPQAAGEPTERRLFTEKVSEGIARRAAGEPPSAREGLSALGNLFESMAPAGPVRPRPRRPIRGKFKGGFFGKPSEEAVRLRQERRNQYLREALQHRKHQNVPSQVQSLMRGERPPQFKTQSKGTPGGMFVPRPLAGINKKIVDAWRSTTNDAAVQEGNGLLLFRITPVEVLKHYYPRTFLGMTDKAIAIELADKANQFLPKNKQYEFGNFLQPIDVFLRDKPEEAGEINYGQLVVNPIKGIKMFLSKKNHKNADELFSTFIHEITHAPEQHKTSNEAQWTRLFGNETHRQQVENNLLKQYWANTYLAQAGGADNPENIKLAATYFRDLKKKYPQQWKNYRKELLKELRKDPGYKDPTTLRPAATTKTKRTPVSTEFIETPLQMTPYELGGAEGAAHQQYIHSYVESGPALYGPIQKIGANVMGTHKLFKKEKDVRDLVRFLENPANSKKRQQFFDLIILNSGDEKLMGFQREISSLQRQAEDNLNPKELEAIQQWENTLRERREYRVRRERYEKALIKLLKQKNVRRELLQWSKANIKQERQLA